MYQVNLFLIQLEQANKLAHSDWPQERRIALILLDNLIELSIRRNVEYIFMYDGGSWEEKRTFSSRERDKVLGYYPDMLSFAVKNELITPEEKILFQFIHSIRNKSYHSPYESDETIVKIGTLIACQIIRENPKKWISRGIRSYATGPGYQNRFFPDTTTLFGEMKELPQVVERVLRYGARSRKTAHVLLEQVVADEVRRIRGQLKHLKRGIAEIDFNIVFSSHIALANVQIINLKKSSKHVQLETVLAYYQCVAMLEEQLRDMPHAHERQAKFAEHFKRAISKRPRYPFLLLKKFSRKKLKYSSLKLSDAVEKAQGLLGSLETLKVAANVAHRAYEDYIQDEVDRIRGK